MALEFLDETVEALQAQRAVLKVIGLGGGGGNAVNHMAQKNNTEVEFICANTDIQDLNKMNVDKVICMGLKSITKGLGAGMRIEVGEAAALEDREAIKEALRGTDMLFIAAGMGGGTGTGSAPIVAGIAKEEGILTVAVVTRPFSNEGKKKRNVADEGINRLLGQVDSLIILPNDRLKETLDKETLKSFKKIFAASDEVLANAVSSITELITQTGDMNIDFADVKTVMSAPGKAMMGSGIASGDNRGQQAIAAALSNPLIEGVKLNNAKGILINIAGQNVGMDDYDEVGTYIGDYVSEDADVKIGISTCEDMAEDEIKVTVVATGLSGDRPEPQTDKVVNSDFLDKTEVQDLSHRSKDIKVPAYLRKQLA